MSLQGAYVTLLTKDSYVPGTLVAHLSLKSVGSKFPFVVMATPQLSGNARKILEKRGVIIRDIDYLEPLNNSHTLAAHDARFADTWTKLRYDFV